MLADERDVADFGLARDGAEWFLTRSEAEKRFRVDQRDTVSGAQRSFTLTWIRDTGLGLSHTAFYSPVANELIFEPQRADGGSANSFLLHSPEGKTRLVRPPAVQVLVESNAHLYTLEKDRDGHHFGKRCEDSLLRLRERRCQRLSAPKISCVRRSRLPRQLRARGKPRAPIVSRSRRSHRRCRRLPRCGR